MDKQQSITGFLIRFGYIFQGTTSLWPSSTPPLSMCSCRLITLKLIDLLAPLCPESTGICRMCLQPFSETRNSRNSECPHWPVCLAILPAQPPRSCLFPLPQRWKPNLCKWLNKVGDLSSPSLRRKHLGTLSLPFTNIALPHPTRCSSYIFWQVILVAWLLLVTIIGALPNLDCHWFRAFYSQS